MVSPAPRLPPFFFFVVLDWFSLWLWEGENLRKVGLKGISLKQTLLLYDKRLQHTVRALSVQMNTIRAPVNKKPEISM